MYTLGERRLLGRSPKMTKGKNTELKAKEIGKRIALARREAGGMTQRELAMLCGVTDRSVAAWESGSVIPYRYMDEVTEALDRPKAWILYGSEGIESRDEQLDVIERKLDEVIATLDALREDHPAENAG